jgi:ligand-binding sensor domain-containing protein
MKIKNQKSKINFWLIISCYLITFSLANAEWKTYTNTNFINDIIGDTTYLYCATSGGFTVFSKKESTFINTYTNADGLPANRVSCLMFDQWKRIWIGTYRGITILDPESKTFSSYPSLGTPEQNIITCFGRAGDTILVGTENGLFVIDTRGTASFSDDNTIMPNLPSGCARRIFSLHTSDDFWVGACPGVIKLNRNLQTYTNYPNPFGDSIKAMTVALDTLYIVSEQGIAKYNGSTFIPVVYFPQNYAVFDLVYLSNLFYIATASGLFKFDGNNLISFLNQDIRTILPNDGLWLGIGGQNSIGGGLKHYTNNIWFAYLSPGLACNNVGCVAINSLGTIYATHFSLDIWGYRSVSFKDSSGDWRTLNDTLINGNVIAVDKKDRIWIGHWFLDGGISCYDPYLNTWSVRTWINHRGVICALGIDHNDTKWIYNENGTIIAVDSLGQTIEFTIPGLSLVYERHGRGYEFTFDLQNRVWLASQSGVVMIDYNNTLFDLSDDTYEVLQNGLPSNDVNSVAIDALNRVWCVTTEGAALLDNDTFHIYNTANSPILSDIVVRVKTNSWGDVWFVTNKGITRYNIYTREWLSYTPRNSGLIPDNENDSKFYEWFVINKQNGFLLVSTKEGISQFFYTPTPPESLSEIIIYPNPFISNRHQVITFDSLPINALVKIYTLEGKLITEFKSNNTFAGARWTPGNLATGIYLAVVSTDGKSKIAKFAIIR